MRLKLSKSGGLSILLPAQYEKTGATRFIFEVLPYILFAVLFEISLFFSSTLTVFSAVYFAFFLYTYFVQQKKVFTVTAILFSMDSLGRLFRIGISSTCVVFLFFVAELVTIKRVNRRSAVLSVLAFVFSFLPYVLEDGYLSGIGVSFSIIMVYILSSDRQKPQDFLEEFLNGALFILPLYLIKLVIFTDSVFPARLGLYDGANPNRSAFYICIGMTALLHNRKLKPYLKLPLAILMLAGLGKTVSVGGFLGMIFVLIVGLSMKRRLRRTLLIVVALALAAILLVFVYQSLPEQLHNESIDAYTDRITEMVSAAESGDYSDATSSRSVIAERKLNYLFNEAGIIHMLFGGNSIFADGIILGNTEHVPVPHNGYLDYLLQFGMVGTLILLSYIFVRMFKTFQRYLFGESKQKYVLILKGLLLLGALSLSWYNGTMLILMFLTLFIL